MQKREIIWIVVLLLAIGVYVHYFTNWGEKKKILVSASIRPGPRRGRNKAASATLPVYFTLDNFYNLTSIKVIDMDDPSTNAQPMWHLVSKTSTEKIKIFQYGENIPGLEPDLKGVKPEPLVPGERYQLEVCAGPVKGTSLPFTTQAMP